MHKKQRTPRPATLVLGPLPVDKIAKATGHELEEGTVVFTTANQVHVQKRHPDEYALCLSHLSAIVETPLYIGDDFKNPDKIELIGKVYTANMFLLIAIEITPDDKGRYRLASMYQISEEKIQGRRAKGFLKLAP